jgi:hypothetical protein
MNNDLVEKARVNPATGRPFQAGDMREDGYRFMRYFKTRKKLDGSLVEQWASPSAYEKVKKSSLERQNSSRLTPLGRAKFLVRAARTRKHEVTITAEWVAEKITQGFCEVSGLPFDLSPSKEYHQNPYAPSLDRIDAFNSVYSVENTRVVLSSVNAALGQYGETAVLPILEAIVKNIKEKQK